HGDDALHHHLVGQRQSAVRHVQLQQRRHRLRQLRVLRSGHALALEYDRRGSAARAVHRLRRMTMKTMRFLALAALLVALPLSAQRYDWRSSGSNGNFDYASTYKFSTTGVTVKFGSFQSGTINFRYPVTNTFGTANGSVPGWTTLHATFTDDSANGSVTITL